MYIGRSVAFISGFPILITIEAIRFIRAKKLNKSFFNFKEISIILFSVYIMLLVAVTMLPIYTGAVTTPSINLVPVLNTVNDMIIGGGLRGYNLRFWLINIGGNLILLTPMAIFIPIIFEKFRNLKSIVALCFFVSLSIEFLQYLSVYIGNTRASDIDDLITNTLGAFLGYLILNFASTKFRSMKVKVQF